MKKVKQILLLTLLLPLLSSCDWLDVDSDTNILEDDLFVSESGYFTALNGIYLLISDTDLYSHNLTKGLYTIMSGMYNNSYYYSSYAYRYISAGTINNDTVDTFTGTIWSAAYKAIANCNNLINYAETADEDIFSQGRKEMIIGEAQAIRALMHFEMLLLFAPALDDATIDDYKLPYVNDFPIHQPEYINAAQMLEMTIDDLESAREKLREIDVNLYSENMSSENLFNDSLISSTDLSISIRGTHMNYFATSVVLCRAYMYKGDYASAKEIALELYEYGPDAAGSDALFTFTSTSTDEFMLRTEEDALFAPYNIDLMEHYTSNYAYGYEFNTTVINSLFSSQSAYDIRYSQLLTSTDTSGSIVFYSRRWYLGTAGEDTSGFDYCLSPVVRFSEAYHILAECYARESDVENAMIVLNQMRQHRGKIYTGTDDTGTLISRAYMPAVTATTTTEALTHIHAEYVRESLDEGRAFWYYKRLGSDTGVVSMLNIPTAETDYMTL